MATTYDTPAGNELDFLWLIIKALQGGAGVPGGGGGTPAGPLTIGDISSGPINALAAAIGAQTATNTVNQQISGLAPVLAMAIAQESSIRQVAELVPALVAKQVTDLVPALTNSIVAKQVTDLVTAMKNAMPSVGTAFTSDTTNVNVSPALVIAGGATVIGWQLTNFSNTATVYVAQSGVTTNSYRLLPGAGLSLPVSSGIELIASAAATPVGIVKVTR